MTTGAPAGDRMWGRRRAAKRERLAGARSHTDGKLIRQEALGQVLEAVIRPGDKVALEGDTHKQADFLSRTLAACDPGKLHDLHMLIGSVSRSEHLDLFEQGIATKLDLAYAGPQTVRIARLVADGTMSISAVHPYVELHARMMIDLRPDVALLCASAADEQGNLYTGPNTEDTPIIAEASAFHDGVVIVQADEIAGPGQLPHVDIPGDLVDLVVQADWPFFLEPLPAP
jgi:malonate decarboxylase alpha subunit